MGSFQEAESSPTPGVAPVSWGCPRAHSCRDISSHFRPHPQKLVGQATGGLDAAHFHRGRMWADCAFENHHLHCPHNVRVPRTHARSHRLIHAEVPSGEETGQVTAREPQNWQLTKHLQALEPSGGME